MGAKKKKIRDSKLSVVYQGNYASQQKKHYNIVTPPGKHTYSPINTPLIAYRLGLLGFTHREIATALGISYSTLKRWKKTYPYFREWLNKGASMADAQVANSLFKAATGYMIEETKVFLSSSKEIDKDGNQLITPQIVTYNVEKHVGPDVKACMYWLNNRQPKNWKSEASLRRDTPNENPPIINIKFSSSGIPPITSEQQMLNYNVELEKSNFYDKLNGTGNGNTKEE